MKKIVIASDSFKGSVSSQEVADAFAQGINDVYSDCEIIKVVIADGGEGSVETLTEYLKGEYIYVEVNDPLGRRINAKYGYIKSENSAIIETSAACGLTLLKPEERNPMKTSSYGVGEIMIDAIKRGCQKLIIGIGGSSTNDAGMGMLQALGYSFLNAKGEILNSNGENLNNIAYIIDNKASREYNDLEIIIACDVTNPLYGKNGAAYIYAPQKGADNKMVELLDNGLQNFSKIVNEYNGSNYADTPGTGAAGGLGFAFKSMLDAKLVSGIDAILNIIDFNSIIKDADIIITGEGRIDKQTLMGKTPNGVLKYGLKYNIPVIAICGIVDWCNELRESKFKDIIPINTQPTSLAEAMKSDITKNNIRLTAQNIIQKYII